MSITYNIYNKIRLFPEWHVSDSPLFFVLICAFMIGFIYTLNIFDWGFISGMGRYWDYLQLYDVDRAIALIGWRYFAHDEWRFPLFFVPMLGYPEGTNIIFTDSIPFIAAIFKLVFKMTGWEFNYFGFWMFLCYILQGMSVALLLYSLGVRFWLANLCGVLIALCAPILILRYGHGALSGHFIIIVSLWTYFILVKNPDRRWAWCVLLAVLALSVLITAYFFVMVAAILMATVFELLHRKQLSFHIAGAIFITACLLIIGVMFLAGLIGRGAVSPVGGFMAKTVAEERKGRAGDLAGRRIHRQDGKASE